MTAKDPFQLVTAVGIEEVGSKTFKIKRRCIEGAAWEEAFDRARFRDVKVDGADFGRPLSTSMQIPANLVDKRSVGNFRRNRDGKVGLWDW